MIKGKENLTTYEFSPEVRRQFCKKCGCSIIYYDDRHPDIVFYYPSTLDEGKHPAHPEDNEHHVYMDSKAKWEEFDDNLPKHAEDLGEAYLGTTAK